jgi:alanine racemase
MTHLAGVSDYSQLALFDSIIGDLNLRSEVLIHAASSKAVQSNIGKYDMDRCGFSMYDGSMVLKSSIKLIQRVRAGEGVSYGWNYRLEETGYVGIIPIGYADGVPRKLVGTDVWINEKMRSMIISVTMDQMIVDLGKEAFKVSVGDEVDLLIHEWPSRLDTISYEVLCGIRKRVPRYYKQ